MASDFERRIMRRPQSPHAHSSEKDRDGLSPGPATTLTHADIAQAKLDSPDEGNTLDFSHRNLGDVGETGAEELAAIGEDGGSTVLRVALGYNRLATLPIAFALLTRLRYLNLRANSFTVFPDVLTVMPSLEILDISRNKLKRLPSQPGTLLGLRVFSLSKNRLTRLPSYIAKASELTVFQVDHNPLEWPPKHVVEPLDYAEDAETMLSCIEDVKRWIEDHSSGSSGDRSKVQELSGQISDESPYRTQLNTTLDFDLTRQDDELDHYANFPLSREKIPASQHARSFSVESDVSTYSTVSQESSSSDTSFYREDSDLPPTLPLHLSNITSNVLTSSPPISPTVSISADNPTSEASDYRFRISTEDESSPSNDDAMLSSYLHGRNASYSVVRQPSSLSTKLATKKSLPDLRGSTNVTAARERSNTNRSRIPDLPSNNDRKPEDIDEPFTAQNTSGDSSATPVLPKHGRAPRPQPSHNNSRPIIAVEAMSSPSIASPQGPARSMDVERNSYFRRLSTLPPSTISATIPEALLAMIDSARGILFAVSQIYQSLRHYTVFAIDDRLSGLLGKVLDPASTYMTHLINALDRFDSVSRRGIPPPSVCRGVLESCRDNVAVFGKVIGVLHLQLKVLTGSDDARYSRSLLLMLYGSMAELSNSWQTMAPHLESVLPLLNETRVPPSAGSSSKLYSQTAPLTPLSTRNGMSPLPGRQAQVPSPLPRTPVSNSVNAPNGRSHMNRRHAGSFSKRDVQIGKSLPSTSEENPPASMSPPASIQPLRSALRKPNPSTQTVQLPLPHSHSSSIDSPSDSTHSRQGSFSPAVPTGVHSPHPHLYPHHQDASSLRIVHSSLEVPADSSKMVDEDLLDTMEAATETARSVWRMMDEFLQNNKETSTELLEPLQLAQEITKRLKTKIQAMRGGAVDGDRKAFWEDAHLFVKAIVSVLTILKAYSASHPFSSLLRGNIAKLTQSTQEFAILLQVSSFSPSTTPGPYSPAPGAMPSTPAKSSSGGISRSRSAQASQSSSTTKAKASDSRDVPWSALPHQSFKIPTDP